MLQNKQVLVTKLFKHIQMIFNVFTLSAEIVQKNSRLMEGGGGGLLTILCNSAPVVQRASKIGTSENCGRD